MVRGPYAASTDAPIHERDVATAGALLGADLVGRRLRMTGPQSLTREEMVAIVGEVIGRPLRYQEIPPAAARQGMIVGGMPESIVDTMLSMWARSEEQSATVVADETAELLGHGVRVSARATSSDRPAGASRTEHQCPDRGWLMNALDPVHKLALPHGHSCRTRGGSESSQASGG